MKQMEVPQTQTQRMKRSSLTEGCESSVVEGERHTGAKGT